MDVRSWNRKAWNREVEKGNRWTLPASRAAVRAARAGRVEIVLTPERPIPADWLGDLEGRRVLGLAAGGGQQGPLLAAAGAEVTILDNSDAQLGRDREVAEREGLEIRLVRGDMRDLRVFADGSFDLVVHPASNTYVPEVGAVWSECHRVLRPGGELLSGFCNPLIWIFDDAASRRGELVVRHAIPYADQGSLEPEELQAFLDAEEPLCFGHSLEDLIGGQMEAGFHLTGFYEDRSREHPIDAHIASMIATRARKPV